MRLKFIKLKPVARVCVCFAGCQRNTPRSARASRNEAALEFECPEEFGYYPHPRDCTQYYVCVFGGALLESCTGGLMYRCVVNRKNVNARIIVGFVLFSSFFFFPSIFFSFFFFFRKQYSARKEFASSLRLYVAENDSSSEEFAPRLNSENKNKKKRIHSTRGNLRALVTVSTEGGHLIARGRRPVFATRSDRANSRGGGKNKKKEKKKVETIPRRARGDRSTNTGVN